MFYVIIRTSSLLKSLSGIPLPGLRSISNRPVVALARLLLRDKDMGVRLHPPKDYGIKPLPRASVAIYSVSFWWLEPHPHS